MKLEGIFRAAHIRCIKSYMLERFSSEEEANGWFLVGNADASSAATKPASDDGGGNELIRCKGVPERTSRHMKREHFAVGEASRTGLHFVVLRGTQGGEMLIQTQQRKLTVSVNYKRHCQVRESVVWGVLPACRREENLGAGGYPPLPAAAASAVHRFSLGGQAGGVSEVRHPLPPLQPPPPLPARQPAITGSHSD